MHWGNVLVRPIPLVEDLASLSLTPQRSTKAKPLSFEARESGIEVTLIDFTLSRAKSSEGDVIFDGFEDECVFEGEGTLLLASFLECGEWRGEQILMDWLD